MPENFRDTIVCPHCQFSYSETDVHEAVDMWDYKGSYITEYCINCERPMAVDKRVTVEYYTIAMTDDIHLDS